jgi:hypothetical protein
MARSADQQAHMRSEQIEAALVFQLLRHEVLVVTGAGGVATAAELVELAGAGPAALGAAWILLTTTVSTTLRTARG